MPWVKWAKCSWKQTENTRRLNDLSDLASWVAGCFFSSLVPEKFTAASAHHQPSSSPMLRAKMLQVASATVTWQQAFCCIIQEHPSNQVYHNVSTYTQPRMMLCDVYIKFSAIICWHPCLHSCFLIWFAKHKLKPACSSTAVCPWPAAWRHHRRQRAFERHQPTDRNPSRSVWVPVWKAECDRVRTWHSLGNGESMWHTHKAHTSFCHVENPRSRAQNR